MQKHLKIQSKEGKLIPFEFNAIQRRLYRTIREKWIKKKPVRLWIPKPRQTGISTFVQALFYYFVHTYQNRNAAVIAHLDEAAENIFGMTSRYHENMPDGNKRPLKYSSKREMTFDFPHDSRYVVSTIRTGDALGKSFTYQLVHASEAASWSDKGNDASQAWRSVAQTIPRYWDTMVFLESTGQGRDPFFYKGIQRCLRPSYRGLYEVFFVPWYEMDAYREQASGSFQQTELEKQLVEEIFDAEGIRLDNDQLEWRRQMIEDECEGEEGDFRRYYPSFLRDCFEQTEHRFFSDATKTQYRRMVKDPKSVGDITGVPQHAPAKWAPNPTGIIRMWEPPVSGEKYSIFADLAEGGPHGDFDAAYVLRDSTIEIVAALHGNRDTDEMSSVLYLLGELYNWAYLGVENNTKADVVRLLWKEHRYPNLFWERDPAALRKKLYRPGWNTNKKTRRILLDTIKNMCRKVTFICPDEYFCDEQDDFVWSENDGRWQAAVGRHDDRIIAAAGVLCISGVDIREREKKAKEQVELTAVERYHLRKKKRQRAEKRMAQIFGDGKGLTIG